MSLLKPAVETVGIAQRYCWNYPLSEPSRASRKLKSVWYIALPISSAHRGGHSGGGALIEGIGGQQRYADEGTVYPHAALCEMITYHELCFPDVQWRYIDLSHESLVDLAIDIAESPPDVAAFSVYTSTYINALTTAALIKRSNPMAAVILGNDHPSLLRDDVLYGAYGRHVVDFVAIENNAPFTMMGFLYFLQGQLSLTDVPSIAYRGTNGSVSQEAPTYPLDRRLLPDYELINDYLVEHYDKAFQHWYGPHYELQRMVTLPLDSGCQWGRNPKRRCLHCSIQGLTPKVAALGRIQETLEATVGRLQANAYDAGDSTLGLSSDQWGGEFSYLDQLAEMCASSPILSRYRFLLAYGLVSEFLKCARLCSGFVRTWNVGIEAFDPRLLRGDSKGINKGADQVKEALELARSLDYRVYASGILGLPGTTQDDLRTEVDRWLAFTEEYQDLLTTVSVAAPAIIPGSRFYWNCMNEFPEFRARHSELLPCRELTEMFLRKWTEVTLVDVERALQDIGRGVIDIANAGENLVKFGGYMMGGTDDAETTEKSRLDLAFSEL